MAALQPADFPDGKAKGLDGALKKQGETGRATPNDVELAD